MVWPGACMHVVHQPTTGPTPVHLGEMTMKVSHPAALVTSIMALALVSALWLGLQPLT